MLIALPLAASLLATAVRPAAAFEPERLAEAEFGASGWASRADGPVRAPKSHLLLPAGATVTLDETADAPTLPPPAAAREKVSTINVVEGGYSQAVSLQSVIEVYRSERVLDAAQKAAIEASRLPPAADAA